MKHITIIFILLYCFTSCKTTKIQYEQTLRTPLNPVSSKLILKENHTFKQHLVSYRQDRRYSKPRRIDCWKFGKWELDGDTLRLTYNKKRWGENVKYIINDDFTKMYFYGGYDRGQEYYRLKELILIEEKLKKEKGMKNKN